MKLCPKCQKQFSDDANFCPVDAARLVPVEGAAPVAVGGAGARGAGGGAAAGAGGSALAAKYQLGEPLGGSRTGVVHRATDRATGAAVAVKLVARPVLALPGVAQRLERELKQLERVQSAGVARVFASGKHDDDSWVAFELIEGAQTLAEAIAARGPLSLDIAAHLIEVIGEALIEAAQVGVVHRDLAPKNVLFGGHDIKLINFSLPVPTTDKVPGVPEFVAPEQVEGKPVDQRSNLYSLGALYYYVLTGDTVHAGAADEVHRAHLHAQIRPPSSLAPMPGPVEAMIMRALDRSPTKRYLTVRQFVDEVGRVARGEGGDARSTQPMGKVGRPKAELVQTLLGVHRGSQGIAIDPAPVPVEPTPAAAPVAALVTPGSATVVGTAVVPPPERSPWAPPATEPPSNVIVEPVSAPIPAPVPAPAPTPIPAPAPIAAPAPVVVAPVVAAPVVAAPAAIPAPAVAVAPTPALATPVLAAPIVAAPRPAAQPTLARTSSPSESGAKKKKGKFRETMWFKKGDLDTQAAQVAAEEREKTGKDALPDKVDTLPIDERYKDDGSISRGDKEKYSLRTGATQMMATVDPGASATGSNAKVSEDALIGEMKGGRGKVIALILVGLIAVIIVIILAAR